MWLHLIHAFSSAVHEGDTVTISDAQVPGVGTPLAGLNLIDSDTHYSEPYDLWTSQAPAKYKERVPQVKRGPTRGSCRPGQRRQPLPHRHQLTARPDRS